MNKMNTLKFHFSIPCSLIDMATRMTKWNQKKAVSFFLGLFSSTQAHLLYSEDFFLRDPAQSYRDLF